MGQKVVLAHLVLKKGLHTWIRWIPPANYAAAKVKGREGQLSPLGHRLYTQNKVSTLFKIRASSFYVQGLAFMSLAELWFRVNLFFEARLCNL